MLITGVGPALIRGGGRVLTPGTRPRNRPAPARRPTSMRPHALALVLALAVAVVLGAAACSDDDGSAGPAVGPDGPAPGGGAGVAAEVELTRSGGCGEAFLWAATEDGTTVVTVGVESERYSTMDPVVVDVDLSDPDVDGELLRGDGDLTRNLCVDVLDEEAEPDEVVPLIEGTGELVVGTIPTDVSACGNVTGTLELDGVVAEDGTELGPVTAETDEIGCFAG